MASNDVETPPVKDESRPPAHTSATADAPPKQDGFKVVWWQTEGEDIPGKWLDIRAGCAEMFAMFIFVVVGCGTACGQGAGKFDWLMVALAFGFGIVVLAYAEGHHSGGQVNCAVTFALVLSGALPWYQGLCNFGFQVIGSILGACLLAIMFPCEMDVTLSLGSNVINENYGVGRALVAEIFGTFILCFTVFETAVHPRGTNGVGNNAGLAIGLCVFLSHCVLLPIDGCSINPTRSLGPAIVGAIRGCSGYENQGLKDLWVMFVGPLIGAALAAGKQYLFLDRVAIKQLQSEYAIRASAIRNHQSTE